MDDTDFVNLYIKKLIAEIESLMREKVVLLTKEEFALASANAWQAKMADHEETLAGLQETIGQLQSHIQIKDNQLADLKTQLQRQKNIAEMSEAEVQKLVAERGIMEKEMPKLDLKEKIKGKPSKQAKTRIKDTGGFFEASVE